MYKDISQDKKKTYKITTPGTHVFFVHNRSGVLTFSLEKAGAEILVFGLFSGTNKDKTHFKTVQHHKAPRTKSFVFIRGVFDEHARFDYEGLIRIEKNAQKAEGHLTNNNLLLSDTAHVSTRPKLEILPNDVICTHAATVSHVNAEQLHFLRTRGLDKKTAEHILVDGFKNDLSQQLQQYC